MGICQKIKAIQDRHSSGVDGWPIGNLSYLLRSATRDPLKQNPFDLKINSSVAWLPYSMEATHGRIRGHIRNKNGISKQKI